MRERNTPRSGKSAFDRGADLFATLTAGFATFFLTSWVNAFSLQTALRYAEHEFGAGWAGILTPLWFVACALATFGLCQMVVAMTLRLGMAKFAALIFRN